ENRVHGPRLNSLSRWIQNDSVYPSKRLMRFGDFLSNIAFDETAIGNTVSAGVLLGCIDLKGAVINCPNETCGSGQINRNRPDATIKINELFTPAQCCQPRNYGVKFFL